MLTIQVIEKEDFIDSAVDTLEEIEEKRDGEVNALTEREEKENREQTAKLVSGMFDKLELTLLVERKQTANDAFQADQKPPRSLGLRTEKT